MKVILETDIVTGSFSGDMDGVDISSELAVLPFEHLRFDGDDIVDASAIVDWLIDGAGQKRLPAMHPGSGFQVLQCAIDDELLFENDIWRIKTDADRLAEAKVATLQAIVAVADQFTAPVLAKYPLAETNGWALKQKESEAIIAALAAGNSIADTLAKTMILKVLAAASDWNDAAVEAAAIAIMAKAAEFGAIAAMVEIMREGAIVAVAATNDLAELEVVKGQLMQSASALAVQYGLA
ncbi:MAG: hypothetical protein COA78_33385 [Blastopirellula sp.]|nr:MAG: hypothetical protein COA78_33385 [Blastopirellula sp.]